MDLSVRRLILLRELETRGSIAAVSRTLGISSSAISQQLAKLEADVGMSLLEQIGRNVRLTDAGQKLALRADEVLAILEVAEAEIESREAGFREVFVWSHSGRSRFVIFRRCCGGWPPRTRTSSWILNKLNLPKRLMRLEMLISIKNKVV